MASNHFILKGDWRLKGGGNNPPYVLRVII